MRMIAVGVNHLRSRRAAYGGRNSQRRETGECDGAM